LKDLASSYEEFQTVDSSVWRVAVANVNFVVDVLFSDNTAWEGRCSRYGIDVSNAGLVSRKQNSLFLR
jgi:hypothetical protein